MGRKKGTEKLPAHVIALAVIGDEGALKEVFKQYDDLISYILIQEIKRWQLNIKLIPIEDMDQQVRADLVKAIRKFTIRH